MHKHYLSEIHLHQNRQTGVVQIQEKETTSDQKKKKKKRKKKERKK